MAAARNRWAARRDASLIRMSQDMFLLARRPDETHGAWYRRCAAVWLERHGSSDVEHADEVRRLSRVRGGAGLANA